MTERGLGVADVKVDCMVDVLAKWSRFWADAGLT